MESQLTVVADGKGGFTECDGNVLDHEDRKSIFKEEHKQILQNHDESTDCVLHADNLAAKNTHPINGCVVLQNGLSSPHEEPPDNHNCKIQPLCSDLQHLNIDHQNEEDASHEVQNKLADVPQDRVCSNCYYEKTLQNSLFNQDAESNKSTIIRKNFLIPGLHSCGSSTSDIKYVGYESELQMADIMRLIQKDLSEPYSIYTYRYFIHNWPKLCFLAMFEDKCIGAVVCKLDLHKKVIRRGYIAMLAVDENYRKKKIGTNLVLKAIQAMMLDDADEIVLETEITNKSALQLYENLGFVRDKRLFRYYLNGVDALRLKLWLR